MASHNYSKIERNKMWNKLRIKCVLSSKIKSRSYLQFTHFLAISQMLQCRRTQYGNKQNTRQSLWMNLFPLFQLIRDSTWDGPRLEWNKLWTNMKYNSQESIFLDDNSNSTFGHICQLHIDNLLLLRITNCND